MEMERVLQAGRRCRSGADITTQETSFLLVTYTAGSCKFMKSHCINDGVGGVCVCVSVGGTV